MNWTGEYIIEADGLCRWRERIAISDPDLVKTCEESPMTRVFIEIWADMGVKVGVA